MPIVHEFIEMLGQYELSESYFIILLYTSTQFEIVDDHLVV